jgi:tetratricopeptide (TPR) repeat protein
MIAAMQSSVRRACGWACAACVLLLCSGAVRGSDGADGAFDAANKLYEQGRFAEAASAYEQLAQESSTSAAVYFNLGNALFKSGQIGRAIGAYRQAGELAPRDPDIRANLQFARNQTRGPTNHPGRFERWLGKLTLNEWALLSAGALWVCLLTLTLSEVRPAWKRPLRNLVIGSAATSVVLCACLATVWSARHSARVAIVISRDAPVRHGPLEESQNAFTAHDGAELRVLDEKDSWLQVSDGGRHIGWLRREQVLLRPPG